jgi:hypothetical protein
MIKFKKTASQLVMLGALLLYNSHTSAELIVNNNSLMDTSTHLEWLFLNETITYSYNSMVT